jgi:cell fate regulator YaaT (PSP1 superfamily)
MSTAIESNFVGVRFGEETNLTLCASGPDIFAAGDAVVVESDEGPAFGKVEKSPMPVFKPCQKSSAKQVLRRASDVDIGAYDRQKMNEDQAKRFCQEKSRNLNLQMKISRVDFALDGDTATIYFTADGRIDFRKLVREASNRFSAKVKMTQVGSRDEAALLGGIGICGQTLCCSTWLQDFKPISIQMAKRQNLSLNPSKISGQCGRLLCCLAYEVENYQKPPDRRKAKSANV